MKKIFCGALLAALATSPAYAARYVTNSRIASMDVTSSNFAFRPASGQTPGCQYGQFYVDVAHLGSAAAYSSFQSAITAAYLSGRAIQEIEYTGGNGGICWVSFVRF